MSKKSSSITFRIDEKSERGLRKLAEENRISLNTLANQIFSDYVECEVFTKKFGTLKMSTDTFRRILSVIPEKDLVDLAIRGGSQEAKEFILFKCKIQLYVFYKRFTPSEIWVRKEEKSFKLK